MGTPERESSKCAQQISMFTQFDEYQKFVQKKALASANIVIKVIIVMMSLLTYSLL
jgi:hypothetical protein